MMAKDKDVPGLPGHSCCRIIGKGCKDLKYADFESFQTYIRQLADQKVGIYACPTCLKIAGFKPEDLMDGVQVAQKDKFFNFTRGTNYHLGLLGIRYCQDCFRECQIFVAIY
ncbi:MAG: hypothetical protein MZV64_12030 [Ignavibacteriales bacterium]|nr:hypothetical protein [Ignavibacteriales bacterium]